MGGRSLKVPLLLKYEGYADQLQDNRAVKNCRKKGFYIILTIILIVFWVC